MEPRYLLVSWGRTKEKRCNPEAELGLHNLWVDAEQLRKDPGANLGPRDTSLRGWQDDCMLQVPAP